MKKLLTTTALLGCVLSATLVSCKKDKVESNPETVQTTQDGKLYEVDDTLSKVEWKGYKVVKSESTSHFGTLQFQSGEVTVKDGKLESGTFTIDMKSLEDVDLKDSPEMKVKLEQHLTSDEFFDVEKFPTATYEITKISPTTDGQDFNTILDGNATIKGITKPLQLRANVTVDDGQVSIASEPTDFNREDFGVKFKMPVENGVLKDEITIQVMVVAKSQE